MRVVMLGWEYPPHISGGLGTACEGLSSGLARYGVDILFVVPALLGEEQAPHMLLIDTGGKVASAAAVGDHSQQVSMWRAMSSAEGLRFPAPPRVKTFRIRSPLTPYLRPQRLGAASGSENFLSRLASGTAMSDVQGSDVLSILESQSSSSPMSRYHGDLFAEVEQYALRVLEILEGEDFDAIHAHDWMTFPAGVALARRTGKPLIAHVHSLERDRSGEGRNAHIDHIEWWGLYHAARIIAVSHYTKRILIDELKVPAEKIAVVHNGIYPERAMRRYRGSPRWPSKVVLFLGRITFQKGPDYFVEAAARVVPHVPDVKFVMAGSGDMQSRLEDRVRELGMSAHFEFPGFLMGSEVEEIFSVADVYVMPSVSEPFGIAALEAVKFDTPVILSRQSGVSEVLSHALKADFWDVDRLAELMIHALIHPEMRADMISMAAGELKKLHWDAAALKTIDVYRNLFGE